MSVPPVSSPCIRCCCLGLDDVCMGCGRHLSEITGWQMASHEEKLTIIQLAKERLRVRHQIQSNKKQALE